MLNQDDLIKKYNTNGPRYTSYPPVPFWNQSLTIDSWKEHLKTRSEAKDIELYIHVPFCEKLCYYCGCNRSVTKDHEYESEFAELILKEWNYYKHSLSKTSKIRSIHFGGGTPTFLSGKTLSFILDLFKPQLSDDFLGSIEIDPRTLREDHLDFLNKYSFKRVSLGIQDFDSQVQAAINRHQSFKLVENVVNKLREANVDSINFDVIYGLPQQTLESVETTFEKVLFLKPDMISFFSYAHLPQKMKNQKLIQENELPDPLLKKNLYEVGKSLLEKNDYLEIGMDHFTLSSGYLWKAKEEGRLERSFMGYTERTTDVLIGLGPSAISDSGLSFKQNHKDYLTYKEHINKFNFSIVANHSQSREDLLIQKCIKKIMCLHLIELADVDLLNQNINILQKLEDFVTDGLLEKKNNIFSTTDLGKLFVRNVAMVFDQYLNQNNQEHSSKSNVLFSQTI